MGQHNTICSNLFTCNSEFQELDVVALNCTKGYVVSIYTKMFLFEPCFAVKKNLC